MSRLEINGRDREREEEKPFDRSREEPCHVEEGERYRRRVRYRAGWRGDLKFINDFGYG